MPKTFATFLDGQFVPDQPVDWPAGTRVVVTSESDEVDSNQPLCPHSPEQRDAWLAWFDSREPLELTAVEQAQMEADRLARKQEQIELTRQK